jgi:hypothetical protein
MKTFKSAPEDSMVVFAGEIATIPTSITLKYNTAISSTPTTSSGSTTTTTTSSSPST